MIALWGVIAYSSVQEIVTISQTQNRWEAIGSPVLQLIVEFQRERQLSAEALFGTGADKPLLQQRQVTDGRVKRLRQVIGSVDRAGAVGTPPEVRALLTALDGLEKLRRSADSGKLSPPLKILYAYDQLISVANRQFSDSDALSDVSSYRAVRGMAAYSATAEYLGREHAVLTSTMVHRKMTPTDRAAFVAAFTSRRLVIANADRDVGPGLRTQYQQLVSGPAYKRLIDVENRLFVWDTNGAPPVDPAVWKNDAETLIGTINQDTHQELLRAAAEREALKVAAYWRIGLVVGLGLLAVIVSVVLSYRFGRSMIAELKRLQASAVALAEERLPRLVERLRRGDDVNPATEAPGLDRANTAEVDRVVNAFSAVQRTAVEAAVGQATLRKGVGQVFLNLAWRNQALLHRQLTLLDTMERRVDEPEILEDLFKLDHLTTRMRRHAENLIILSDSAPARRWRDPVPLFDVVRGAVLEVEDYTRVIVPPMPQAPLLVGAAVADVIHLVAELVENATVFSPPDTVVHVRSTPAANGFALEVEDRGLGLNQATLDELNAKLADPPEFDLVDTDRLGLFVVARLAARHGIKIVLRPSPYDGTTAIVLLPTSLLASPEASVVGTAPHQVGQAGPARRDRTIRGLGTATEARPKALSGARDRPAARVPVPPSGWFLAEQRREHAASPAGEGDTVPDANAVAPTREGDTVPDADDAVAPTRETVTLPNADDAVAPTRETVTLPNADDDDLAPRREAVTLPNADDDDLDGLPVRVRQANLAPQLRQAPSPERHDVSMRSPEELQELMSTMQRGWQQGRGRVEQEQDMRNRKEGHPDARPQT
jgi:signal transduction histidine kinase